MKQIRLTGLALAGLLAAACGSSEPNDGRCTDEDALAFQVSDGFTPAFNWTPACTVAHLRVTRLADEDDPELEVWAVQSSGNTFAGPVTYGTVPSGATEITPKQLLEPGKSYILVVAYRDHDSGQLFVAGQVEFTR